MSVKETIEAATAASASAAATKVTYVGGAWAVAGSFLHQNWIGIGGLIIGVAGLIANIYFRRKELRIKQYEHRIAMKEKGVAPVSDLDSGV